MPRTFNHVGLTVSDLDRSSEFYLRLGFEETGVKRLELTRQSWLGTVVGLSEVEMLVSVLSYGGTNLELLQYLTPEGSSSTPLGVQDAGNVHLGVEVDDVPAEYERLTAAGVKFVSPPVHIPTEVPVFGGVGVVYGYDPDGNCFEVQSFPWNAPAVSGAAHLKF